MVRMQYLGDDYFSDEFGNIYYVLNTSMGLKFRQLKHLIPPIKQE